MLPKELREGLGIHPVGRLDINSTGALILTNDGELTYGLTHPSHSVAKTYHVLVKGHPPESVLSIWSKGVVLEGQTTRPAKVKLIKRFSESSLLEIILQEGRNRQIRRIAQQLGYPVINLHRTAIGGIQLQVSKLSFLPEGNYRYLTQEEIGCLQDELKNVPIKHSA